MENATGQSIPIASFVITVALISQMRFLKKKWQILKQASIFYLLDIVICFASKFIEFFNQLSWSAFFDFVMATTTVVFFAANWTNNKGILNWKNFSLPKLGIYCLIAIIGSLVVHYTTGWLNIVIYSNDENYYWLLKGNWYAEFVLVFFVAVMPAIFEELGYRTYLLQALSTIVDRQQAIYISAFLFAILHLSFISLFWLIPFALFLGYTRFRENTIWYGVIFHFVFNLTSCLLDIYSISGSR